MGMPAVLKQTGTGTMVWTPDWMQTPFQVGVAMVFSGGTGTASVEATFDDPNTVDVNGVATATWWSVIGTTTANATANFTTPVQAMRVNLFSALATSVVTVTFVQATFPR